MRLTVRVDGEEAVILRLDRRQGRNLDRHAQKAALVALRALRPFVKAEAPVSKGGARGRYAHSRGNLRDATRVAATKRGDRPGAYIGPSRKRAHYRHMVIGGHATRSGGRVPANPYVTRAASKHKATILKIFSATLIASVQP